MSDSQLNQVEEDIKNYSDTYTPVATKKKSNKQYVINKKEIPSDKNAYVYQNHKTKIDGVCISMTDLQIQDTELF